MAANNPPHYGYPDDPPIEYDAPTPKQREEREDLAVVREELELHKGDILSDFVARRRGVDRAEDVDRRARRILSRLRTHSPEERVGWRPIETAPKDGSEVLGYNGKDLYMVNWSRYHEKWFDDGGFEIKPTHWMPLPEPPIGQPLDGEES